MADQNQPATGKDVRVELLLYGVPQNVVDQVVRFTERPRYQTVESRKLGTTDVDIDTIPDGWEGEIEFHQNSPTLDEFIDAYNLARKNRVPVVILITRTKYFRDGTAITHVYQDVKISGLPTESSRGQALSMRMTWMSGKDRI